MKHIGFLIPASNIVAERELYTRLVKDEISDVSFHFARLKFQTPYGLNEEKYTQELVDSIPTTLKELERIKLYKSSVLCTSAEIFAKNTKNLLFPLSSIIAYLKFINKTRPLIITPYNKSIGNTVTQTMRNSDISISKKISELKYADSVGIDFHKTGFCPYASSIFMVKDKNRYFSFNPSKDIPLEELVWGNFASGRYKNLPFFFIFLRLSAVRILRF